MAENIQKKTIREERKKKPRFFLLLIIFITIYTSANLIWLFRDNLPPPFDQAAHALYVLKFHQLLENPEKLSLTKFLRVTTYWPPFFHFWAALVTQIFGFSPDKIILINFFFLILLAIALYQLSKFLFTPEAGLLTVFMTLMSPLVFGLVRDLLIDFCLLTIVVLVQYLIIESQGGWRLKTGFLLGLTMGFSLLTKWTSAAFFAITAVIIFILTWIRESKSFKRAFLVALVVIIVALAVALPWYVKNYNYFRSGAQHALFADSKLEGDPTAFWPSLTWYLFSLKEVIISNWLLPFFLIGFIAFFLWVKNWLALFFCLAWVLPSLFIFILIPNKDARFILPLFPALAVLSAAGLVSVPWKKVRSLLVVVLILAASYQFVSISFGWPKRIDHPYAFQAFSEDWAIEKVLDEIARTFPQKELRLAVLANQPYFNANNFRLYTGMKNYPYLIEEVGGRPLNFTQLTAYNFLILKTGEIALEHTARYRNEFLPRFWQYVQNENRHPSFALFGKWPLPDGSEALVYRIER